MENVLINTGYIDTNTIFFDNLNTITLRCNVNSITINEVAQKHSMSVAASSLSANFVMAKVKTEWVLEDIYGDTLNKQEFEAPSGHFKVNFTKPEEAINNSIADAIEVTMIDFMNTEEVKNHLKFVNVNSITFDNLFISKPLKAPTDIEQALQAVVTIKTKDSHGSGFLISNDGYILTNHHVISAKSEYTVVTSDGTEYKQK